MKVKFLQAGGEMPAEQAGGAPAGAPAGGGAEEQLAQMAIQIVQQLGPEAAAALAQMIMQVLQQASGAPTFQKKGGKLQFLGRK